MILYLKQYEDDWVVLSNICYLLNMKGKPFGDKVECLEKRETTEIQTGEVAICGHGYVGKIGAYNAEALAVFLEGISVPINLFSCSAGCGGESGAPSLVEALHDLKTLEVRGKLGDALTAVSIGERVVLPECNDAYYDNVQDGVLARYGYATEDGCLKPVSEIWPALSSESDIVKKAMLVGKNTMECYGELVKEADKLGFLYPFANGVLIKK